MVNIGQQPLFELSPPIERERTIKPLTIPLWTEQKAKLIAQYVRLFTMVTKHGAYIDGFAGPQTDRCGGCWAAEEVLSVQPPLIRRLFLCEVSAKKIIALQGLKAAQPAIRGRTIEVMQGDFNRTVDHILRSGAIGPKVATFALLDQHTFECDWATVQKLAKHKPAGSLKIELFYFIPTGWLGRAAAGLLHREREMIRWWGRSDWHEMIAMSAWDRAVLFAKRMQQDLGYRFVMPWPVREERSAGRIMYHMLHASDHPEAPQLMNRAYRRATTSPELAHQLDLELGPLAIDLPLQCD